MKRLLDNMKAGWVAAPLLFLVAGCGGEQVPDLSSTANGPLAVRATLSTNAMHVGDLVTAIVSVEHPAGGRPQLPDLARGKEVVVRNQSAVESKLAANRIRTDFRLDLTSFVTGLHVLSSNDVVFVAADGQTLRTPFPITALEVSSILTGTEQEPRGIKGLAHWPSAIPRWIWVFLLVAMAAFLIGLLVRRWLSQPRTILHMPPPIPPHEKALAALRELWARGWVEAGRAEAFYIELSGIVRHYLEERFSLKAPERTTEEFIREASQSRLLSADHQALTRDFLEQCDLVKFARHQPQADHMRAAFGSAERLVQETIPAPTPSPEAPA